jgi:hypothetical protein
MATGSVFTDIFPPAGKSCALMTGNNGMCCPDLQLQAGWKRGARMSVNDNLPSILAGKWPMQLISCRHVAIIGAVFSCHGFREDISSSYGELAIFPTLRMS